MTPSSNPPFEKQPQGISLDELAEAFAQVMRVEPPREGTSQQAQPPDDGQASQSPLMPGAGNADDSATLVAEVPALADEEDLCPLSPRTILEAMLFVGNRESRPLSPARLAELMRDVDPSEIPSLVDELNRCYVSAGAPYRIVGEGDGYRLALGGECHAIRNRFYGRIREARLSQAAIDVLALVAYQQPITGETIGRLRAKPSSHVLAHLVRRGLLRIERPDANRRTSHYHTTDRFLRLFSLQSLDDLPRSEEAGPP
jgi:segregation and condensation protein B